MDGSSDRFVVHGGGEFIGLVKQASHNGVKIGIQSHSDCDQVRPRVENFTADIKNLKPFHHVQKNTRIQANLGWEAPTLLNDGLRDTHVWIESQSEALACV